MVMEGLDEVIPVERFSSQGSSNGSNSYGYDDEEILSLVIFKRRAMVNRLMTVFSSMFDINFGNIACAGTTPPTSHQGTASTNH